MMANLVLPNGHGHGWRPDTFDINDEPHSLKNALKKRVSIPPQIYLDPASLPKVRDQGQLGSCTGFGTTGALMWSYKRKRKADVQLSPLFAYYQGRVIEASVKEDSGCEIRDVVKAAAGLGVSLEKYWPYNIPKFTRPPTKAATTNAKSHQVAIGYHRGDTVEEILQALAQDMPVVGGYSWFSCLSTAEFERTGVMPMPVAGRDKLEGGHCNFICGADVPSRTFILQNSYGPEFGAKHPKTGEGGYVIMPFAYLEQGLADDMWAVSHE